MLIVKKYFLVSNLGLGGLARGALPKKSVLRLIY
jgi:hypothetical protein